MRPLRLELEGFTVYKKRQVIDFEKLNFFIIQGKTGAGKTSIVDAITYALYGKVPRYGGAKATRYVISKGSQSLRVVLDFSVRGKKFRIERFYSPRLREDQARAYEDGRRLNLSKSQIEEWVKEITGLDYTTFTKVILLPQGEFDRFLKPKQPKERRDILINLLNLSIFERMREIASQTYKEKEGELKTIREELERLKGISEKDLEELEAEEKNLKEKVSRLEREVSELQERIKTVEDLKEIEEEIRKRRREKEAAQKDIRKVEEELRNVDEELERVEREATQIPSLKRELHDLVRELERVETALRNLEDLKAKERKVEKLREELGEEERRLEDLNKRVEKGRKLIEEIEKEIGEIDFDEERFTQVTRDLERKKQLEVKTRRLKRTREEIKELEVKFRQISEELERLNRDIKTKEEELKIKNIHLYAHQIRESLEKGDTCPVCGGVFGYEELPPLDTATEDLRKELEDLTDMRDTLGRERARIEGRLEALRRQEEELTKDLKGTGDLLGRNLEEEFRTLKEKRDRLTELRSRLDKFRKAYDQRVSEREEVLRRVERIRTEINSLEGEIKRRREEVTSLLGDTDPQTRKKELELRMKEVNDRIERLEKRKEELRGYKDELERKIIHLKSNVDSTERSIRDLEAKKRDILTRMAEAVGETDLLEDLSQLKEKLEEKKEELSKALETLGEIRNRKDDLRKDLARKGELERRRSDLERDLRVYKVLAEDLRGDRLQNFVASLMILRIVERASQYLLNFTGTYELTADERGNLLVIDRVQGVEREVSSLSGGETFLASLSLALGVSDVLSSQANLESLFIDEGFGSLDEETRERVSEILEVVKININRMVGIISHIPDLAERFHQRIVVKKHGDFSTVEVFY